MKPRSKTVYLRLIARPRSKMPRMAGIPSFTEIRLMARVPKNTRPMTSRMAEKGSISVTFSAAVWTPWEPGMGGDWAAAESSNNTGAMLIAAPS
jgi:hypothetical protein